MTSLATGSSATVTLRDDGKCTVTTNGGDASVVETVAGVSTTHAFGPRPMRMAFGPYSEGASLVITNTSAVLDYDSPQSDVRYARDSSGNVTGLVGPDGVDVLSLQRQRAPVFDFRQLHGLSNTRQATGTGDLMEVDTTIKRHGASTIKLTLPSNGTFWGEMALPLLAHKFSSLRCGWLVYIPDFTKIGNITTYLAKDAGYAAFVTCAYKIMDTGGNANRYNGWHYIQHPDAINAITVGAGTVAAGDTITTIKVRVNPAGGTNSGIVYFDSLYQIDAQTKPAILITADDCYDSWYTYGFPYLQSKGLKHTHSVIGSVIGTGGYMTLAQMQAMYAAGHDFVTHGAASLADLASAKLRIEDVLSNVGYLRSNAFVRRKGYLHYVYPTGVFELSSGDQEIRQVLVQAGMLTGRGVDKPARISEDVELGDRSLTYHILGGESTDTPAALISLIDDCVTYGETGVLMFHKIVTGTASTAIEYNKADFEGVIDHIAALHSAGSIDVLTVPQWYERRVAPASVEGGYR